MLIGSFVVALIFKLAQPVVISMLLAVLLAYVMDPLMMGLKRLGLPLALAVTVTAILFLGLLFGAGTLLVSNLLAFARKLPGYKDQLLTMLENLAGSLSSLTADSINLDVIAEIRKLPVGSIVAGAARQIATNGSLALLVFLFSILILVEKYFLPRKLVKVFAGRKGSKIPTMLKHIDTNLRRFIGVRTFVSLLIGTFSGIVLALFGVEFAIVWGFLTFLLNFIPNIGSWVAMMLPPVFSLIQFAGTATPFWIFLVLASCQFVTGMLLEPKIMGNRMNLSLFIVFLSMFFWGWLWGALGVLLAVPMTASIKIILKNIPATSRYAVMLERMPRRVLYKRSKRPQKPKRDAA
jgi:predicted PurR-regulated permease PerM